MRRPNGLMLLFAMAVVLASCAGPIAPSSSGIASLTPTAAPLPTRIVHTGYVPVETGEPIRARRCCPAGSCSMTSRMCSSWMSTARTSSRSPPIPRARSSTAAGRPTASGWCTGTRRAASTRTTRSSSLRPTAPSGGTSPNDPANDWGPDWSPDGSTIVFNSDRDGGRIRGYLVDPDGSNLRALDIDAWVEYPSFSPDGTAIAFMGHEAGDYEIYVADIATGETRQLTDSPGSDGWPVWSPDGSSIAFTSERDDCSFVPSDQECWQTGEPDRPASRRLGHERGRLGPASRHERGRPVCRLVAGRPLPPGLGPRAVRGPARRDGPVGAPRRRHRPCRSAASRTGAEHRGRNRERACYRVRTSKGGKGVTHLRYRVVK